MAKVKKRGTKSEERVKFLTKVGNINAKKLKSRLTKWELIIRKVLSDLHYNFKMQVPIITQKKHLYIVDFLLTDFNIFLEINGKFHYLPENKKKDNRRSNRLQREGYFPLVLTNSQVSIFTPTEIDNIIRQKIALVKLSQNSNKV